MKLKSFRDLKVWQSAHQLSLSVAQLVKPFPKEEKYRLADQMIRAADSAPANIAEGFKRFHYNDKLSCYERASASISELEKHFAEALGNKYITEPINTKYIRSMKEVSFLIARLTRNIRRASDNDAKHSKFKKTRLSGDED